MQFFEEKVRDLINWNQNDPTVLGVCIDVLVRIEFQLRGDPHAHMLFWMQGAPDLETAPKRLRAKNAPMEGVAGSSGTCWSELVTSSSDMILQVENIPTFTYIPTFQVGNIVVILSSMRSRITLLEIVRTANQNGLAFVGLVDGEALSATARMEWRCITDNPYHLPTQYSRQGCLQRHSRFHFCRK